MLLSNGLDHAPAVGSLLLFVSEQGRVFSAGFLVVFLLFHF